ncbi:MAG: hypothetical protein A2289_09695 [Deltaproteobacteria bacterium RIFOXYA12_FULL_58_15]|nr:MAG: hypothetical protein A2289_09695 [Deltaproteobacteria bacterium RIFOXYA12_FULL_58_15]
MAEKPPVYYDIERLRARSNKFLWAAVIGLGATSVLSLFLSVALAAKPAAVIEFDCKGEPRVIEDTYKPALSTSRVRVEFFITEFLKRMVLIDSSGKKLETQLAEALAMMTPKFAEVTMKAGHEVQRRVQYKDANVYSQLEDLELLIGDFEPTDEKIYFYWLAKNVFRPLHGEIRAEDDELSRWLIGRAEIVRVPVTTHNPFGLQIGYFHYDIYSNREDFDLAVLKLKKE